MPNLSVAYTQTSWFFKFCECTLAIVALLNVLMMGLEYLPDSFWEQYGQYFQYTLLGIIVIEVLGGAAYAWVWHRREHSREEFSGIQHAWLQGIIRYWLAFEISIYGFAKIFRTQFDTPPYQFDTPIGDLSGFQLTWFYYGYSYTLAVIIALFQIGGSSLLLYRRTTLLGVMILLPVLVNIVLINLFFEIAAGAFFNSVVFTLALLFLLALDWDKLKRSFWDVVDRLPPVVVGRHWTKFILRLLPILAGLVFILFFVFDKKSDKVLVGTWKVEQFTRNGRAVGATAWLADTTAWNRVYFSNQQEVAFIPNPYRYKPDESLRGSYAFDSATNTVRLMLSRSKQVPKPDTLLATLSGRTHEAMRLRGVWWRDTLDMQLTRLR